MLCCGLLVAFAATIAGAWRLLGSARWVVLFGGGAALLAVPAILLGTAGQEAPLSRADVIASSMQRLCGPAAY
jgi:hypothetical protein